jgi:hypothetical protein
MLHTNSSTSILFGTTTKINPFSKILCTSVFNMTFDKFTTVLYLFSRNLTDLLLFFYMCKIVVVFLQVVYEKSNIMFVVFL